MRIRNPFDEIARILGLRSNIPKKQPTQADLMERAVRRMRKKTGKHFVRRFV